MRNKTIVIYYSYLLLLLLPCTEIALRILGYRPFLQQEFHIKSTPKNCITAHPFLGFALQPGGFHVTINEGLNYTVTHGRDSLRISRSSFPSKTLQDSIYFFGCSYTYGMGISDSLTFPFLIQEQHPQWGIKNFAAPGYGSVQSYLQIKQLLQEKDIPSTIIINYADFHDDRNALTPAYRRDLFLGFQRSQQSIDSVMQMSQLPFVEKINGHFQFTNCSWADIYHSSRFRETFALVNFAQDLRDQKQMRSIDKEAITIFIFEEIKKLCQQHQIRLLVTGITDSERTKLMLSALKKQEIETLDMPVDLSLDQFHNAPYDDHPNSRAHAIFADRILAYLATFE